MTRVIQFRDPGASGRPGQRGIVRTGESVHKRIAHPDRLREFAVVRRDDPNPLGIVEHIVERPAGQQFVELAELHRWLGSDYPM